MPNYKLSPRVLDDMKDRATYLTNQRVEQARTGFPLTRDQVQQAVLPAKWRDQILEMEDDGVEGFVRGPEVNTWLRLDLRGLEREVKLNLSAGSYYEEQKHLILATKEDGFDLTVLPPAKQAQLAEWANNLVLERRLANLAQKTINTFLNNDRMSKSVGHVVARWPALTILVQDTGWRHKFASPPVNLKPYRWLPTDDWPVKNKKAIQIAEMMLTSGAMLPSSIKNDDEIKATLTSWKPLPGDTDKP